ncbi:GspE/PulE family protein [Marinobacterium arenosum]|uniref:GspE/PulE family protein n=1 Tax=Marinobacterium arenosum TaxID=2862496 RepID=UPI001C96E433|nr:GspE/PulE family protein [Marinobacterium arenosum]MBY4676311.1 GspE/PulE family protein [Marinobacterium arenosum]
MTADISTHTDQFYARLTAILSKIHEFKDFTAAFPVVEKAILALFGAERVTVYQRNRHSGDIVSRYKTGDDVREIRVPISTSSIAGFVAFSRHALLLKDVRDHAELKQAHPNLHFDDSYEKGIEFKSHAMVVVPIEHKGVLLGVLQIINRRDGGHFTEDDLKRAEQFAALVGQKFRYDFGCTEGPFEYLVDSGLLDGQTLARLEQKASDKLPMTRLLKEHAKISSAQLGKSLECYYQVPFLSYQPDRYYTHPIADQLNKAYLRNSRLALLTDGKSDRVLVLIDDPNDSHRVMEIENVIGSRHTEICVGLLDDIQQYLGVTDPNGGSAGNLSTIVDELEDDGELLEDTLSDSEEVSEEDSTVVRLVNRVLLDARRLRASDVHIEPGRGRLPTNVRMRIDGVCQEIIQIPASHARATVSRIKIMSRLDIAERRMPQDGKFSVRLQGHPIDVRVATIPTVNGEGVVMRLLQSGEPIPFDQLNLSERNITALSHLLTFPHGILLVVGPTGSGKTTTLHAVLSQLNTPDRKIWTAEDPVEITQPGLQQVQVQPKIGFDFAAALRSFLRADPDVILIGEMRDRETSHAGVEASLTGHLVLSTLHTNSAPETVTRLLDLGIDPVSFSDALLGILAQRLVRTLCDNCKEAYTADEEEVAFLQRQFGEGAVEALGLQAGHSKLYRAKGCDECNQTGYRGRTGIHELLTTSHRMRELIYRKATVSEIKQQATTDGMLTLLQDGILKVVKGDIDFQQLRRVTAE